MNPASEELLSYSVVSLSSLEDEKYEILRVRVMELLREFKCERSSHLQEYARDKVSTWENHGHSRTYVFIAPGENGDITVPAFFAVGMNVLNFASASGSAKKKLMGNISQEQTGAFCITELARSDDFSPVQLPGETILNEAKNVIREARKYIGGRFLVVDSQKAVFDNLYSKHDFKVISLAKNPGGMDDADFVTSCCVIKDW